MMKMNLRNILIVIIIIALILSIKRTGSNFDKSSVDSGEKCKIIDGIIVCENGTGYSNLFWPFWYYRYPYHRTHHLRAQPYRRMYGRRHGRD